MCQITRSNRLKTISVSLAFFFCLASGRAQFTFSDGFESGDFLAGFWTVTGGAQVSMVSPSQGMYCAEGPATWGLAKTTVPVPGNVLYIEFDARASQKNTTCMVFRAMDNMFNTSCGMFFNDLGELVGVDSSGPGNTVVLMPYDVSTWYSFRFELDLVAHTYDIYIDNSLVADDFNFYSAGFTTPSFFTWSSIAGSGSAWLDGVNIYSGFTGVAEQVNGNGMKLFPNPAESHLRIANLPEGASLICLYDAGGRPVLTGPLAGEESLLDVGSLGSGLYLAEIRDREDRVLSRRLVVKL